MTWMSKIEAIVARHEEVAQTLATGGLDVDAMRDLGQEFASLDALVGQIEDYRKALKECAETAELLEGETDADLKVLAEEEHARLETQVAALEVSIRRALLPKDSNDGRNVILEVRAGTGGDEATLFVADLLRMYERYAALRRWGFELMEAHSNGIGGYSTAIAGIRGKGAYGRLKFERGTHRVQRVPQTESAGRVHTSAATVAVLPEADDVEIDIQDKDLRVDTFRAQGAGGQHVNTTDSAVRITHIPSGLVVSCQDEKSQHKNRSKAMKVLRARLLAFEQSRQATERAGARKAQIGTGDRSERVRTYNFPQGRLSDHRINLTLYKLESILGGEGLDEVIDALVLDDEARRLASPEPS